MAPDAYKHRCFVKKIPPSGGAPAYKLTLTREFVERHLSHLINSSFELAATEHVAQCWQGSIGIRRNKERSEFILKGWKLFAEAHNLQAGEEVCFEAFGPSRLVVKRVQSRAIPEATPISATRKLPDSPLLGNACSKSLKSGDFSSPSRHSSWMSYQKATPFAFTEDLVQSPQVPGLLPQSSLHASDAARSRSMAHQIQSWLSVSQGRPSGDGHLAEGQMGGSFRPANQVPRFSQSPQSGQLESKPAHSTASLPGIFDCIDDLNLPDLPITHSGGIQLGKNSASPNSVQTNSLSVRLQDDHLDKLLSSSKDFKRLQDQLELATRGAVQATVRIERGVTALADQEIQQEGNAVLAKISKHLAALKESLWQVLVIASDGYSPTSSTTTVFKSHR